jgi:hypothetical protein
MHLAEIDDPMIDALASLSGLLLPKPRKPANQVLLRKTLWSGYADMIQNYKILMNLHYKH